MAATGWWHDASSTDDKHAQGAEVKGLCIVGHGGSCSSSQPSRASQSASPFVGSYGIPSDVRKRVAAWDLGWDAASVLAH